MGLGHADGQLAEPVVLIGVQLATRAHVVLHTPCPVHLPGDDFDLLPQRSLIRVEIRKLGRLFGGLGDRLGELHSAGPAIGEVAAYGHPCAHLPGDLAYGVVLRLVVRGEGVDRDHRRDAVEADILYLFLQVGCTSIDVIGILSLHLLGGGFARPYLIAARVGFERPHRGHQNRRVGLESRVAALDVEEAFCAHVSTEACLGYEKVTASDADQISHDRRVPCGDIAEGAGVDQGRRILQSLHEVGFYGFFHDDRHDACGHEVLCCYGVSVGVATDHEPPEAAAHVVKRGGEREDRHRLRGSRDVEAGLARDAVGVGAKAHDYVPQGSIVYVHHPSPGDALQLEVEGIALVEVVVDHGGELVMGLGDRVDVTGEVQIERLHRHDLAVAAAGGAALDAEHGTHRSLAHSHRRRLADMLEGLPKAYGSRRLPLTQRGWRYGGDHHVFGLRPVGELLDGVELYLGDALSVGLQEVLTDAYLGGDLVHRQELRLPGGLQVLR